MFNFDKVPPIHVFRMWNGGGASGVMDLSRKRIQPTVNSAENVLYIKPFYTNYVIHIRGYTHISYITLKGMETSLFE